MFKQFQFGCGQFKVKSKKEKENIHKKMPVTRLDCKVIETEILIL